MDFIQRDKISLVVIDIQEKLINAIPEERRETTIRNSKILIETAKTFEIPITVTEQYPKGLGLTTLRLKKLLEMDSNQLKNSCLAVRDHLSLNQR